MHMWYVRAILGKRNYIITCRSVCAHSCSETIYLVKYSDILQMHDRWCELVSLATAVMYFNMS